MKFRLSGREDASVFENLDELKNFLLTISPEFRGRFYSRKIEVKFDSEDDWYKLEDELINIEED